MPTAQKPLVKMSLDIEACPNYQYIEARGKQFMTVVQCSQALPLQPRMTNLQAQLMYTRFSPIVQKDFGAGVGCFFQWDYAKGRWTQVVRDPSTGKWVAAPGSSKKKHH